MNTIDLTNKMKEACEGLTYIAEEYSDCARKMEGVRERCKPRTSCLNLFGEKNCAVDAIIERCSLEEWIGFRNVSSGNDYCSYPNQELKPMVPKGR